MAKNRQLQDANAFDAPQFHRQTLLIHPAVYSKHIAIGQLVVFHTVWFSQAQAVILAARIKYFKGPRGEQTKILVSWMVALDIKFPNIGHFKLSLGVTAQTVLIVVGTSFCWTNRNRYGEAGDALFWFVADTPTRKQFCNAYPSFIKGAESGNSDQLKFVVVRCFSASETTVVFVENVVKDLCWQRKGHSIFLDLIYGKPVEEGTVSSGGPVFFFIIQFLYGRMEGLPLAMVCNVMRYTGTMRYCRLTESLVEKERCRQQGAVLGRMMLYEPGTVMRGPMDAIMVSVNLNDQHCLRKVVLKRDPEVAPCISYIHWHGTTYYACLLGNCEVLEPPAAPVMKNLQGCDYVLYVRRSQRIVVPIEVDAVDADAE